MKKITNGLVKATFLSLCSIFYFLEVFFYYTFTSPVDPGVEENQVGDLRVMLILCFIKIVIIITYILILNKLKLEHLNSYILIFAFSIAAVGVILPTIQYAHDLNIIIAMRIFIPIILNVVIATVLGRYLLKVLILSKRLKS
ncbi:hypothetical protein [Clostridium folliculivorans]|uniref:Uncharacterized protein n=1 Tax=Clostridium folliculivorans TaxID=2886038 RepID=A0A9W5Y1R6_9CLOT|nr:hypothetical protein [Clostridium folliculivorans]GKU25116.1 hypothetical protein CFOLD11_19420 [Clostridium folliculivorans]GKU31214.1 hypothetical protein CFB3_33210 [Clostridium folliculivorans]